MDDVSMIFYALVDYPASSLMAKSLLCFCFCLWTAANREDSVFVRAEGMEWMAEMYRGLYLEVQIWISCTFPTTPLQKINEPVYTMT